MTQPSDLAHQIWKGILKLQRKSRLEAVTQGFGSEETSSALTYTDGLVLLILETEPDITIGRLAEILGLERSWVSRVISALEKRSLVRAYTPPEDKRSKKVSLSKKGRDALDDLIAVRRTISDKALSDLTAAQQEGLSAALRQLADGLGAPDYPGRPGSNAVDMELARISWSIGVIGENFMKSGLNVTQYQILFELANNDGRLSVSELYERLPFDLSTISRTITGFEKSGYVQKFTSDHDRRSSLSALSPRGRKKWEEISSSAANTIRAAARDISDKTQKNLASLLELATHHIPGRGRAASAPKLEISAVSGAGQISDADMFLKQLLSESGKAGTPGRKYVVSLNDTLHGVIEISRHKGKEELSRFVFAGSGITTEDCFRIIKSCLKESGAGK